MTEQTGTSTLLTSGSFSRRTALKAGAGVVGAMYLAPQIETLFGGTAYAAASMGCTNIGNQYIVQPSDQPGIFQFTNPTYNGSISFLYEQVGGVFYAVFPFGGSYTSSNCVRYLTGTSNGNETVTNPPTGQTVFSTPITVSNPGFTYSNGTLTPDAITLNITSINASGTTNPTTSSLLGPMTFYAPGSSATDATGSKGTAGSIFSSSLSITPVAGSTTNGAHAPNVFVFGYVLKLEVPNISGNITFSIKATYGTSCYQVIDPRIAQHS